MSRLLYPIYLLDSCCIVDLDNRHRDASTTPSYSPKERGLIWDGLEDLAQRGELRTIALVKEELSRWDPDGLRRLEAFPIRVVPVRKRSQEMLIPYRRITSTYPHLAKPSSLYEKADPWLIVVGLVKGYTIVTDEKRRSERTNPKAKKAKQDSIADACDKETISCLKLRELARSLGWIS